MSKKFKSKWFRVAVEGATSDKRVIERSWLEQAAKNFKRETFGARIWLEHFRGLFADSAFPALGDVLALKTEEVDIFGKKKLALFAQIDPTDELVAMNKKRQKMYTSIEIDPAFSDTNQAYMVGLAVTDSPASLGTEMLAFCQQNPETNPFNSRHYSATSMFSEAVEIDLEFEELAAETPGIVAGLFAKVNELLGKAKNNTADTNTAFADVHQAVEALATHGSEQETAFSSLQDEHKQQAETIAALTARLDAAEAAQKRFSEMLDSLPASQQRPAAAGGAGTVQTDC